LETVILGFFILFFKMSREEETTSGAATNSGVINTVSLKLPTFKPEEVEVWFAQAEAQDKVLLCGLCPPPRCCSSAIGFTPCTACYSL